MKKLYPLGLLVVPLFLAAAWMGTQTVEQPQQQELVLLPAYSLESAHYSMEDLGRLFERMGRDIQQEGEFTIGGVTYPLSGYGGVEFNVGQRRFGEVLSTGAQFDFGSDGRTTTPVNRRTRELQEEYDPYERGGRWWEPAALADLLDELGETLANTGTLVMEYHSVPFKGAASIDQRLLSHSGKRARMYQNELEVHVLFGEGEFEGPDDDEDYVEDQEYGILESLARSQEEGADRSEVAEVFTAIAENLRAGRVRVGDQELPIGPAPVTFGLTHVTATDGSYDKIEFSLMFGREQWPPAPRDPSAPRYYDEQFNEPLTDLAAVLQQLAAQILEDGTFELGGETFSAGNQASWDIYAGQNGFSVEVTYQEPPE
jgi:hypothetical protein